MKQIIMVKNNNGGIGKTFVSINLADYLSKTTVNGKQASVLVLTDDGQNNILASCSLIRSDESRFLGYINEVSTFEHSSNSY